MSAHVEDNGDQTKASLFGDISSVVIAAHELKAPLSLLRQLSLSLADETIDQNEQKEIVQHMILTSERAMRLTGDLTRAHKLQTQLFELEPVNSQQLCEDVAYELAPLYLAHGREIRVCKRRQSLLAVANRDLLHRVMLNFADNALHYAGGNAPVELSASSHAKGSVIRLGVRDYGPAIPIDTLSSLVGEQLIRPQALAARPGSSGLGLSIAKQFAEAMNGTIGATRHRDGVTFYVDMQASRQLNLL
ncbi:MAG: HAMP domain-containing sensor histidine kinase [Candidatus Saccharibacteria bacterium]